MFSEISHPDFLKYILQIKYKTMQDIMITVGKISLPVHNFSSRILNSEIKPLHVPISI